MQGPASSPALRWEAGSGFSLEFLPWFRAGGREGMRGGRREKVGETLLPQPSITLMPGSLGKGEHYPQTGAVGCQQ